MSAAQLPEITINFTENHTSYGLTFYFVGSHPLEMEIFWYDIAGVQIARKVYAVDSNRFFVQNQVENYGKIRVRFTKTIPHRYIRVWYIEYGTMLYIGNEGLPVMDAKLTEEADPISDKIPINKLTYKIIDEDDTFNIGNINGLHKVLQNGQRCTAYERVNDRKLLLGNFFLTGNSTDKNVTSISSVDYKGLLDNTDFLGGRVYDGDNAGGVIDEIMAAAGIKEYSVSDEVRGMPLYGWLKNQTCRKALREVLFACGAVIDDSRRDKLEMFIPEKEAVQTVARSRKFSTQVNREDYISDVSVKYSTYTLQDKDSQILKGDYPAGIHTVKLSSPAKDMVINSGLILEQSTNYVTFKLSEQTSVIITGKKYNKEDYTVTRSIDKIEGGTVRKSKNFTGTLINGARAQEIAEKILDYYGLQLELKIKIQNEGDRPAQWAEVQNNNRQYGSFVAGYEKLSTDLTGGFLSTATLRGYYKMTGEYYYTGELYAGEEMGVI